VDSPSEDRLIKPAGILGVCLLFGLIVGGWVLGKQIKETRLADRYVVRAALAIANGQNVPDVVAQAFTKLPPVMARADALGGQIERAVVDLAEAVMLKGCEGRVFPAIVTDVDERGARMQLRDQPVVARVAAHAVHPGDAITVRLIATDPERRVIHFERVA